MSSPEDKVLLEASQQYEAKYCMGKVMMMSDHHLTLQFNDLTVSLKYISLINTSGETKENNS